MENALEETLTRLNAALDSSEAGRTDETHLHLLAAHRTVYAALHGPSDRGPASELREGVCHGCEKAPIREGGEFVTWLEGMTEQRLYCEACADEWENGEEEDPDAVATG